MRRPDGRGKSRGIAAICGALTLFALLVAGCGSDEEEAQAEAEEQIRAVLTENLAAQDDDGDSECAETVTDAYVERLYGSEDECRELLGDSEVNGSIEADDIEFEAIDIDGSNASVQVAVSGGDLEGVEGGVSMVDDSERGWLFDDFDGDLARSSVLVGLRNEDLEEPLVDCIEDELFGAEADDEDAKQTYIDLVQEGEDAEGEILDAAEACTAPVPEEGAEPPAEGQGSQGEGEGLETVDPEDVDRETFERELRENLLNEQGLSEAVADCTIKRLRRTLSDDEITVIIERGQQGEEPPREILRKLTRAGAVCARSADELDTS